jgi:hypothetical protein
MKNKVLTPQLGKVIALLLFFLAACTARGQKNIIKINNNSIYSHGNVFTYTYVSEGIGYSDIARLYATDSLSTKRRFFESPTINTIGLKFECTIRERVLANRNNKITIEFEIAAPIFSDSNSSLFIDYRAMSNELLRPIFIEISPDGRIMAIQTDSSIAYATFNFIRGILSHFQFVSGDGRQKEWEVVEENSTGSFTARYKFIKKSTSGTEYQKRNSGYIKINTLAKGEKVNVKSICTYLIDSGIIRKAYSSEACATIFGNDTISIMGAKATIGLKSIDIASGAELAYLDKLRSLLQYHRVTTLGTTLSDEEILRRSYLKTLGRDDLFTLLGKLKNTPPTDKKAERELVFEFKALIYLYPENCKAITSVIIKEPLGSFTFRVLIAGLANAQTNFGTDAISEIIKQRKGEKKTVTNLLPLLTTTQSPTVKAANLVKELATDITVDEDTRSEAQLCLGSIANHIRKSNPLMSDSIVHYILNTIKVLPDTLQQVLILGNTGSGLALPVLRKYCEDRGTSAFIRLNAVSSLKFIRGKSANAILNKLAISREGTLAKEAKGVLLFREKMSINSD